jgi:hypothetical protein
MVMCFLQAEYPPAAYLSADAKALLERMLCPDPAERATVVEVTTSDCCMVE